MAHVDDSGSNGRSANTELNLVPFIDLMSVLITFLLITAVWSQVSMIQIGSSIYGKKSQDKEPPPPPKNADIPLRLDVMKNQALRLIVGPDKFSFPKTATGFDVDNLLVQLKKVKTTYPDKGDAVITVDDELEYESLIMGMDALIRGGFPSVSVSTVGAE